MSQAACRVIVDSQPQTGAMNMAIDAALLESADASPGNPVVRIYRWSEPTVTLGYFQKDPHSVSDSGLQMCPHVRRLTGGGAILHHHEITYSCVLPRTHPLRAWPLKLYEVMHSAILDALKHCHVSVGFRASYPLQAASGSDDGDSYLCFLRSDPRDLVALVGSAGEHPKVVGSAQRRRRGTILQHGSILVRASPLLPGVSGISDLYSGFDESVLMEVLPLRLGTAVSESAISSDYTDQEHQLTLRHMQQVLATS